MGGQAQVIQEAMPINLLLLAAHVTAERQFFVAFQRTGVRSVRDQMQVHPVIKRFLPVDGGQDIAPAEQYARSVPGRCEAVLPFIPHRKLETVPADIDAGRQAALVGENVGQAGVQVGKGIIAPGFRIILLFPQVGIPKHRIEHRIGPGAANGKIEGSLFGHDRAIDLETAFQQTEGEGAVVVVEIAFPGGDIDHRRGPAAEAGREAALVEIQRLDGVGVEGGKDAAQVADLVERHAVEQIQVVAAVTAVDIEIGKQFRAGSHARQGLQGLDHVRYAQRREGALEGGTVEFREPCLRIVHIPVDMAGNGSSGQ